MTTEEDFFARLRGVMNKGWYQIPDYPGYRGTGGPGLLLEELLGYPRNKRDSPDSGMWEIKFHGGTSLLTLFHKTPEPKGNMHSVVRSYGWPDAKGRTSFRHTIFGKSERGFKVVNESNRIIVRNTDVAEDVLPPYWTHDTLINAFVYKLRRLAVVHGEKKKDKVRYISARLHWEPMSTMFIQSIVDGLIAIDFDARTTEMDALRDHGTKFRIEIDNLKYLYRKNQIF